MGKKGQKRKMSRHNNHHISLSPTHKRCTPLKPRYRNSKEADDQHDLHLWYITNTEERKGQYNTPANHCGSGNTSSAPMEHGMSHDVVDQSEQSDDDAIGLPLNIAKDAASVKADIKRVGGIIINNRNTHASEQEALLILLNTIQD